MLDYLDGLHGNQRGVARKRAKDVMTLCEKDKNEGECRDACTPSPLLTTSPTASLFSGLVPESKVKYKRAVQVMRVLSK